MRKVAIYALFGLIVAAGAFAAARGFLAAPVHETAAVHRGEALSTVYATGYVEARQRRSLAPPRNGIVEKLYVKEGDEVRKGDLLLMLRDTALASRLEAARAELENIRIKLAAGSAFRTGWANRLAEAEQNAATARERADRLQKQLGSGGISRDSFDEAETRAVGLEERAKSLRQDFEQQISDLEAAERKASADLGIVLAQQQDDLLVAPLDGVVLAVRAEEGEFVAAGVEAVGVGDMRELIVEADVNEDDIRGVRSGADVKIHLAGDDLHAVEGKVYEILPDAARATKSYTVRISLPGAVFVPEERGTGLAGRTRVSSTSWLYSGMTAELGIVVERRKAALVFPRAALTDRGTVFVLRDGRVFERSGIEIGISNFLSCEAISGLEEGEVVVVSGVETLSEGQRIKAEEAHQK